MHVNGLFVFGVFLEDVVEFISAFLVFESVFECTLLYKMCATNLVYHFKTFCVVFRLILIGLLNFKIISDFNDV